MILAIDTATPACSAALIGGDGRLLGERHDVVGRGHAERLLPMVAELLDGGVPDAILVDRGPGSFTGVRVGLAAARGLAIGWRVPVHGFSSLALIAATALAAPDAPDTLAVAIGGGHGELFVQRFARAPFAALGELRSLTPEAAAAACPDAHVIGSGATALVAARGHGEAADALPRAACVTLLPDAFARLPATPLYGRAPDAKLPA